MTDTATPIDEITLDWTELDNVKAGLADLLVMSKDSLLANLPVLNQLDKKNLHRLNAGVSGDIDMYVSKVEAIYARHATKSGKTSDLDDLGLWHDCMYQYSEVSMEAMNHLQSSIANLNAKIRKAIETQTTEGTTHE